LGRKFIYFYFFVLVFWFFGFEQNGEFSPQKNNSLDQGQRTPPPPAEDRESRRCSGSVAAAGFFVVVVAAEMVGFCFVLFCNVGFGFVCLLCGS
jgi:hypothetical protein